MKTRTFILAVGLILVGACIKSSNPLLNATDGQFIQAMEFTLTECGEAFFEPAKVRHPYPTQKQNCANRVKENAAFAGISNMVKLEHIEDPQVKERYFKLKK